MWAVNEASTTIHPQPPSGESGIGSEELKEEEEDEEDEDDGEEGLIPFGGVSTDIGMTFTTCPGATTTISLTSLTPPSEFVLTSLNFLTSTFSFALNSHAVVAGLSAIVLILYLKKSQRCRCCIGKRDKV